MIPWMLGQGCSKCVIRGCTSCSWCRHTTVVAARAYTYLDLLRKMLHSTVATTAEKHAPRDEFASGKQQTRDKKRAVETTAPFRKWPRIQHSGLQETGAYLGTLRMILPSIAIAAAASMAPRGEACVGKWQTRHQKLETDAYRAPDADAASHCFRHHCAFSQVAADPSPRIAVEWGLPGSAADDAALHCGRRRGEHNAKAKG